MIIYCFHFASGGIRFNLSCMIASLQGNEAPSRAQFQQLQQDDEIKMDTTKVYLELR